MERIQIISIDELARLSAVVFDRLRASGLTHLSTQRDLYWHISFNNAFDMTKDAEVVVGDAVDDVEDLRREVSGPDEDFFGWHALEHLSGLLKLAALSDLEHRLGRAQ